MTMFNNLFLMF